MPYTADISRNNPSCFLFVIDQSGSMEEKMEIGISKAQFVADVLNKTLYQLVIRCQKPEGVRNYFDIGVLTYGGSGVSSGLQKGFSQAVLHPISEIEANPLRVEDRIKKIPDGAGGVIEQRTKFPIWFDPTSSGGTPMMEAVKRAVSELASWCDNHRNSYPPTVIHVTDGQPTDGDPEPVAEILKKVSTDDGEVLVFNLHIDAASSSPVVFPASEIVLPDTHSKKLFRMSSQFPQHLLAAARQKVETASSESKFFCYKAGYEAIVDFFEIGTRPSQLR